MLSYCFKEALGFHLKGLGLQVSSVAPHSNQVTSPRNVKKSLFSSTGFFMDWKLQTGYIIAVWMLVNALNITVKKLSEIYMYLWISLKHCLHYYHKLKNGKKVLDNKGFGRASLMDFSKAFVRHSCGFDKRSLKFFFTYLNSRGHRAKIDQTTAKICHYSKNFC